MVNDGVTAKKDGRSSGRVLVLVAEVTLEKEHRVFSSLHFNA
jgi:hypothetical protein